MSIRRRMTLTIVGVLLLLLGLTGAALYAYTSHALVNQFDETVANKGKSLAALLRLSDSGKVEFDFSDNAMPEFAKSAAPEYFQLWRENGVNVERSESLGQLDLKIETSLAATPKMVDLQLPDGRLGRAWVMRVQPISENNEDEKPAKGNASKARLKESFVLALARERVSLDNTLTTIGAAGIGGVVLLALAFGMFIPWLIVRNLKPLDSIGAQAGRIDAKALGVRFDAAAMPLELQPICNRLNDLLERLQGAFERERRFSADVAHELRTPIAELRLLSELALKFPPMSGEADKSFKDSLSIALQMESIVETLLEMIASEAPVAAENLEDTSLVGAFRQAWRACEVPALRKQLSLKMIHEDSIEVSTDPTIVGRTISNLLSNAVEYSPAGSNIEMEQQIFPDRVVVSLQNPTSNLQESDLPHLAEPFWRKDAARTSGHHAGLGLSLVACYARKLNIKIEWTLPRPGIFQVVMEFPRGVNGKNPRAIIEGS